jgi:CRISPR/Cas system-associated exonuclease Cas4 (RecB family)
MITLAPGVTFDKEAHEYYYKGVRLSGITCRVGPVSGYGNMSESFKNVIGEMAQEGNHVHEAVEDWIKSNLQVWKTIHPNAIFVRDKLLEMGNLQLQAETLVSDFKQYASAIDILSIVKKNVIDIYDIKRSFSREYVTWQLSIYKYLVETHSKFKVRKMCVFATKDKRFFDDIEYKGEEKVKEMLYGKEEVRRIK